MEHTLAGLPSFAPMLFHLFISYSLIAFRSAALCNHVSVETANVTLSCLPRPRQIRHSACPENVSLRHTKCGA